MLIVRGEFDLMGTDFTLENRSNDPPSAPHKTLVERSLFPVGLEIVKKR